VRKKLCEKQKTVWLTVLDKHLSLHADPTCHGCNNFFFHIPSLFLSRLTSSSLTWTQQPDKGTPAWQGIGAQQTGARRPRRAAWCCCHGAHRYGSRGLELRLGGYGWQAPPQPRAKGLPCRRRWSRREATAVVLPQSTGTGPTLPRSWPVCTVLGWGGVGESWHRWGVGIRRRCPQPRALPSKFS
jgi:hypothetical protein